ncbi:MAG: hypothetical protein OXF02_05525 [Simkaniaceae bacterium]|nr:hypothetical protein [Simkaniaceae bacterium]
MAIRHDATVSAPLITEVPPGGTSVDTRRVTDTGHASAGERVVTHVRDATKRGCVKRVYMPVAFLLVGVFVGTPGHDRDGNRGGGYTGGNRSDHRGLSVRHPAREHADHRIRLLSEEPAE